MALTEPVNWLKEPHIGYMVNAEFSEENKKALTELNQRLAFALGTAIFSTPHDSLHITLLDWIAPLIDYDGQDKDALFRQLQPDYDAAMAASIAAEAPFSITFDELHVSPSTIYITGHDNGAFARIRQSFLDQVDLLPGTKLPPKIIHSSLARFVLPIALEKAANAIASQSVHIEQPITDFRLVRSVREPLLDYEVLKRYPTST